MNETTMNKRTTKARKWIVAGVSAGALAGGVAGFMVTVPGGAGAATSSAVVSVSDTATDGDSTVEAQHHGRPHLSPEERAAKFVDVLQALVDDGTLTSAQVDSIVTALTTRPETPPAGERPDPTTIMTTRLQALVDDGTITTAERDTVIATLQAARPDHEEGEGADGGRGGRGGRHLGEALDTAASVIGVTADELKTALQSGESIADVATANGVDPQTVIDALVADATANLTQRITDMVNGVRPADAPADPAS
jgi:hypothetical protein